YNLPARFDLWYRGADGRDHRPVMIHRAPFGSLERFTGVLIEHFAGNFPLWLAPEQVRVLPVTTDSPALLAYAEEWLVRLRGEGVRASLDAGGDRVNAKIARAEAEKVHTMFVVGERDRQATAVSVRVHGLGNLGAFPAGEAIEHLTRAIQTRQLDNARIFQRAESAPPAA
ncbi:MAG: His/Gly/Thr/Pro-type tRNA ligase C-terminal domain-containing protein, partial [Terrimicrobiaceae bacterium]|nr:His/Gly/Thr/Pro-type tRNA ligase C-terminal domain-containing protein [Terrimicrobiaceae bacterium]